MDNVKIEIPECLIADFTEAVSKIQDKYYYKQVTEKKTEAKNKILEAFMAASTILEQLENVT